MDTAGKLDSTWLLPVVRQSMNDFTAALPIGKRPAICTDTFCAGLASFLTLLAQTNEVMNLTSDADPGHLLATHIRDSLAPLLVGLEAPHLLLDIGTGGGFPAVPLALAWPTTTVTMSESIGKKAHFLELSLIHISEPTRLGMISYAVFCLKKKKKKTKKQKQI